MNLFDDCIRKIKCLLNSDKGHSFPIVKSNWPDMGNHQMILKSDMAYELGGSTPSCFAIGGTLLTSDSGLVPNDSIVLLGKDIDDIYNDISFARIVLVRVNAFAFGTGNDMYNYIKKIENVKYHINPKGYMPRLSSVYGRESVRVSKSAVEEKLSLSIVGNMFVEALKKIPGVEAVSVIFVTDDEADYKGINSIIETAGKITSTIDHIMKEAMTDCNTCSLQKICDEVEGLRKMHFGQNRQ